jgi:hypothetical protein
MNLKNITRVDPCESKKKKEKERRGRMRRG